MGQYREFRPPQALVEDVECFWTASATEDDCQSESSDTQFHSTRVIPDGCVDIIFDVQAADAKVVGAMTIPIVVPSANRQLISVRFKPGAAAGFVRGPIDAMTDEVIPLTQVWSDGREIADQMADFNGDHRRQLRHFVNALLRYRRYSEIARPVQLAVAAIQAAPNQNSISTIANHVGLSRQYLARRVRQVVGLGPKEFARVMRFRRLVEEVRQFDSHDSRSTARAINWAKLAVRHGYYDQSHFAREFKRLAGLTPSQYFRHSVFTKQ